MKPKIEELKEKLKFYEYIFDNINALVYVNRFDGPVWYNKKTIEVLGMTPEKVKAYGLFEYQRDFYHPDDMFLFEKSIQYLNNPKIGKSTFIYRQKDRNKEYFKLFGSAKVTKRKTNGNIEEAVVCGIIISDTLDDYTQLDSLIRENALLRYQLKIQELTKRELQILKQIAKGLSTKEIAGKEKLSFHTVETHRKNLLYKLGVSNVADLVRIATECEIN